MISFCSVPPSLAADCSQLGQTIVDDVESQFTVQPFLVADEEECVQFCVQVVTSAERATMNGSMQPFCTPFSCIGERLFTAIYCGGVDLYNCTTICHSVLSGI